MDDDLFNEYYAQLSGIEKIKQTIDKIELTENYEKYERVFILSEI